MNLRRIVPSMVARPASLALTAMILIVMSAGCTNDEPTGMVEVPGRVQVVGTLVTLNDGRPVDGGVDLTLVTSERDTVVVRVPSAFTAERKEYVMAMHRVVDTVKIGDRLRARGLRDPEGAVQAVSLERL